jgi:hypothetical protein
MADAKNNASTNAEQIQSKHGTLIRHRFTVPEGDTDVETWVNHQSNLSFSLRMAIKLLISEFGAEQDITCLGLPSPVNRVGRPRKDNVAAIKSLETLTRPTTAPAVPEQTVPEEQPTVTPPEQAKEITEVVQAPAGQPQEVKVNEAKVPSQVDPNDLGL